MSEDFSYRFKRARLSAGLKAKELAVSLGISASYISMIESGKKTNVSEELLIEAAKKMGVSVNFLVKGKSDSASDSPTATHCRYPEACDIQAEFGQVREELASVEASLASMTAQLDAVTRLLGAALGSVLPSQRDHKTPNKRLAG
jgi:transcriptional regulator with XRE-family HTH domain